MSSEIHAFRDFLYTYNMMTEHCFNSCIFDFTGRSMNREEQSCVSNCVANNMALGRRLAVAFAETMSEVMAKRNKEFDFSKYFKYARRRVALLITYIGWEFDGFCAQRDTVNTVEAVIFKALLRCKLIESVETANYQCCGRTDKTVSGLRQVISLDIRSSLTEDVGVYFPDNYKGDGKASSGTSELDYPTIINGCLPRGVRVLAWAVVSREFSARFNCLSRTYRYFFPRGSLDVQAMNAACGHLLGTHDFRNFCKVDSSSANVQHCIREVKAARILEESTIDPHGMCCFEVTANAFLRHQIRCIIAVLFSVGLGLETPDIVRDFLDTERYPRKPQYAIAPGEPLVLRYTNFDGLDWQYSQKALSDARNYLQSVWVREVLKARVIQEMLSELDTLKDDAAAFNVPSSLIGNFGHGKSYTPLFRRPLEKSLQAKLSKAKARSRKQGSSPIPVKVSKKISHKECISETN